MRNMLLAFLFAGCLILTCSLSAQTFTTLHLFDGPDGDLPNGGLIQATDGNFYGTAYSGGTNCVSGGGCGTVFKIAPEGTLTTIYSFCAKSDCIDGSGPYGGLIQATTGDFYGTTTYGGANSCNGLSESGCGTLFKITAEGTLTTLYNFCSQNRGGVCEDGQWPFGPLVQGTDGSLYGTTLSGGSGNGNGANNGGTIFKITPDGKLTTLYNFCSQSNCPDGARPFWGVIQAADGDFYGTTSFGGANGDGTLFKITSSGKFTLLQSFPYTQAARNTASGLIQASDGDFYGTTNEGGDYCDEYGCGTVFKMTPSGVLTTLFSFDRSDGEGPYTGVIQATDGNFYGTAAGGGANCLNSDSCGTVFEITPSGTLTTLYNFCSQSNCSDGELPFGALVQSTNGSFYGATMQGGNDVCSNLGCGTIFSVSNGLGPFVETQTPSGKVGAVVNILGTNLSGATKVTFDGTLASFKVVSSSLITATVPSGAETGNVKVSTPGGTLKSNAAFRVTPQVLSFSPTSGPVGTQVLITGVSLTQTEGVGFGDQVRSAFTVDSDTRVTATVPNGAKTGPVGVVTKGGVAVSAGDFTVMQ